MRKLTCLLLVLVLTFSLFTLTAFADGDKAEQENPIPVSTLDIATVPDYTGSDYIVLNDNVPDFYLWQITKTPYVRFSAFDELGRTGAGMACLGKETLPAEVRARSGISGQQGGIQSATMIRSRIDISITARMCSAICFPAITTLRRICSRVLDI